MEHAIIDSDLSREDIQPSQLIDEYLELLNSDIREILLSEGLIEQGCPTNGETMIIDNFQKMGLKYNVSETFGNIYISPRPNQEQLIKFYRQSKAREFWLTHVLTKTIALRKKKLFHPHLEWIQAFVQQYSGGSAKSIAEYYPNHWGYYSHSLDSGSNWEYKMVDPLFLPELADIDSMKEDTLNSETDHHFDAIVLFEALDRSINPSEVMNWVKNHLKDGGLCFITCLLASGFEIKILGESSTVFIPPERMNLFSVEGMIAFLEKMGGFEIIEFSTPGVFDIPNVIENMERVRESRFLEYLLKVRNEPKLIESFMEFLQSNRLSTFGRLVLQKNF